MFFTRCMTWLRLGLALVCSVSTCIAYTQLHLRSASHRVPDYIDFWKYSPAWLPESIISTNSDSSAVLMFYSFERDKQLRIVKTEVTDVSTTMLYAFRYYYNDQNQMIKMEKLADMNYDGKVEEIDHSFVCRYDSLGRVVALKILNGTMVSRDLSFFWQDENIVRVENTDGELNYVLLFTYDTTPNLLREIAWEYITTSGTIELYATLFSQNNITGATLSVAGMDSTQMGVSATYDSTGLYISNGLERITWDFK